MEESGGPAPKEAILSASDGEWLALGQFWVKVLAGVLRVPAFALFIGIHLVLDRLLDKVVPAGMGKALLIARTGVFLVFLCVYVQLGVEVLAVFVPGIRRKTLSLRIGPVTVNIGDGSNHTS